MRFLRNAITAARHPSMTAGYIHWLIGNLIGRPRLISGAFETRLHAMSYSELLSARNLVPDSSEIQMIKRLSRNCPVFLDVGANVGVWTIAMAAAHPRAHVYSFEPTPKVFGFLCDNIALNNLRNVTALQLALSEKDGDFSFQVTRNSSIFNRLAPPTNSTEPSDRGRFVDGDSIDVRAVCLDEFCKARRIDKIGFLKLDVEGAETRVLRGAERLLRDHAIEQIWIEVDADNLQELGDSLENLADFMKSVGYSFHVLSGDGIPGPPVDVRVERRPNMMAAPAIDKDVATFKPFASGSAG